MFHRLKQAPALIVASAALFIALGGGAYAATSVLANGSVGTPQLKRGAVTNPKIHQGAISGAKLAANVRNKLNAKATPGPAGPAGPAGPKGATGATGPQGPQGNAGAAGATGPKGQTGSDGGAEPGESIQTGTPDLTLDAAPGPNGSQGSSGFGWDNANNAPVSDLTVGTPAPFSATALSTGTLPNSGQITFTFDTDYLAASSLPGNCAANVSDAAFGYVTCSWSGSHSDQSEGITLVPQSNVAETVVTATVTTGGEQASQQVPISIG